MVLPIGYKKIGNRVYFKDGDVIRKFTYDTTKGNYLGSQCSQWTVQQFLDHETTFDGNTEEQYNSIKIQLGL